MLTEQINDDNDDDIISAKFQLSVYVEWKSTEIGNKTANINTKNIILSIILMAMYQQWQNHKKMILLNNTLTFRRCASG